HADASASDQRVGHVEVEDHTCEQAKPGTEDKAISQSQALLAAIVALRVRLHAILLSWESYPRSCCSVATGTLRALQLCDEQQNGALIASAVSPTATSPLHSKGRDLNRS